MVLKKENRVGLDGGTRGQKVKASFDLTGFSWGKIKRQPGKNIQGPRWSLGFTQGRRPRGRATCKAWALPGRARIVPVVLTWLAHGLKSPVIYLTHKTPHGVSRCHEAKGSYKHLARGRPNRAACFYQFIFSKCLCVLPAETAWVHSKFGALSCIYCFKLVLKIYFYYLTNLFQVPTKCIAENLTMQQVDSLPSEDLQSYQTYSTDK